MKTLILLTMLLAGMMTTASAQSAKLINDTLTYNKTKYYVGKEVQLMYDSKPNKEFDYVFLGNVLTIHNLPAYHSKETVIINKLNMVQGKCYAVGTLQQNGNTFLSKRITINIEGAVDFKEVKED